MYLSAKLISKLSFIDKNDVKERKRMLIGISLLVTPTKMNDNSKIKEIIFKWIPLKNREGRGDISCKKLYFQPQ